VPAENLAEAEVFWQDDRRRIGSGIDFDVHVRTPIWLADLTESVSPTSSTPQALHTYPARSPSPRFAEMAIAHGMSPVSALESACRPVPRRGCRRRG
jgi:hypothetical protein